MHVHSSLKFSRSLMNLQSTINFTALLRFLKSTKFFSIPIIIISDSMAASPSVLIFAFVQVQLEE